MTPRNRKPCREDPEWPSSPPPRRRTSSPTSPTRPDAARVHAQGDPPRRALRGSSSAPPPSTWRSRPASRSRPRSPSRSSPSRSGGSSSRPPSSRTTSSRPPARPASRSPRAWCSRSPASCSSPPTPRRARRWAPATSATSTLFALSLVGGILGVLMMIPLRRSLIVKEHGQLLYPEGTACASVLIAGEKGGELREDRLPGRRLRARLRDPPEGLPRHRRDAGLGHPADEQVAPERHRERRDHPRVPGRRLHHRAAHRAACSSRAACSPGSGSSRSSRCSCRRTSSPSSS